MERLHGTGCSQPEAGTQPNLPDDRFWPNPGRRRLPLVRHPHPSPVLLQSGRSIQVFDLTVMLPSVTWAAVQLAFGHCKTNKLAAHVSGCICVRFRAFPWLTNSFFVV